MRKINVITLGCSKNTVDSEHLMARLEAAGYEVVFDSDRTDAKVVVINTCGFIASSAASRSATPTSCGPSCPRSTTSSAPATGRASPARWAPPRGRSWPPSVT